VARIAIGDVQGCYDELRTLLERCGYAPERDRLWLVGDLVNRGPRSLEVLRFVRALGDSATVVLGNHDLHLLAVALGTRRTLRGDDTLDAIFEAPDRDLLLEWLLTRPLAHFDAAAGDLLIHGGLVPEWTVEKTLALAREVESALRDDPRALFDAMYGDRPDRWSEDLSGFDRLRFIINVLTRMRFCTADGRIDLRMKGPPSDARPPFLPWFAHEHRRSRDVRVIFGHWSTLGYYDDGRALALDTGCVWGGALTAVDLDDPERPPVSLPCRGYQAPGGD
jgi:bis(5''-nucleosyl)-tetraphosphatase (symmetrical)